jgi:hypothetical protein
VRIEEKENNKYCLFVTSREALAKKQIFINKENDKGSLVRYSL